jgi:hypothetical protein
MVARNDLIDNPPENLRVVRLTNQLEIDALLGDAKSNWVGRRI